MTVQLDWPRVVDRLTAEAREKGLSLDDHILRSVLGQGALKGITASSQDSERAEREEAGRSIRELRKSNILGPDLTIRDLIEEGRRF
jgi:hypothetical protein